MGDLLTTVLLLLLHFDAAITSNCTDVGSKCKTNLFNVSHVYSCYIYTEEKKNWTAIVTCYNTSHSINFTCDNTGNDNEWYPTMDSICAPEVTSPSPKMTMATATSTRMPSSSTTTTAAASLQSSITNTVSVLSEGTATSESTWMSTSPAATRTQSSSAIHSNNGSPGTTVSALTTAQEERTNGPNNNTLSTQKSPVILEDSGSVVVPIVSVFVVVVITLVGVIVFLLWRRNRMKAKKTMVGFSGTSISNSGYEDDHGLDRHISLLDMRPDNSVDSEYAEISPGILNVEERPGNLYQTIDNIPEDKTECDNEYGHLKIQTTTFIDNNYSHVTVDQNKKRTLDTTYALTGNTTKDQELKKEGENETTYNHLETNVRKPQGIQQLLRKEETEEVNNMEAEYNHAKAGHLAVDSDAKGDTYSHLHQTCQRSQANQQNGSTFLTQASKPQMDRSKPQKLDSDNDVGRNTFPDYAKCIKKLKQRPTPKPVGSDGYETPTGTANIYLTLEPDSKPADADLSFQVTNGTFEDSESPHHQYFILEKFDTDT